MGTTYQFKAKDIDTMLAQIMHAVQSQRADALNLSFAVVLHVLAIDSFMREPTNGRVRTIDVQLGSKTVIEVYDT